MCPWVLLPEHPGGRHKSVVGTVFPSQNRYRAPRRTALNPGFASRGPETGEEVPCGVHSQTHRKGPEGGAGNPASFLSRLGYPTLSIPPSRTLPLPGQGGFPIPLCMLIRSTHRSLNKHSEAQELCLASGCHGRVRRRGAYPPGTPGIQLKGGRGQFLPPV